MIIFVLAVIIFIIVPYIRRLNYNDPVIHCDLYKEKGCSHVDGYLCDYPNCTMNYEFRAAKSNKLRSR